MHQDEDVLDTWFSSGMWPFSTLGYPEETEELKYFYPTSTLVTGYDIIFFWVARMIVFGEEVMKQRPFDTVYVHGIVRDSQGRKMSKSLGNGIDPLEVIEKYGADSLRFSLLTGNSAGNDMRFYWEKVEAARNFCNKVYNAARFVLMSLEEAGAAPRPEPALESLDIADKWILHRLNDVTAQVTANLDGFELGLAAQKIYDFIWTEFCDWYIEMAKPRLYGGDAAAKQTVADVLAFVLGQSMKLLHPFMPFITEELYQKLPVHEETIMRTAWPKPQACYAFESEAAQMEAAMEIVRGIRNLRAEMKVPPAQRISMRLVAQEAAAGALQSIMPYLLRLAGAEDAVVTTDAAGVNRNDVRLTCAAADVYIPLASLVDLDKERARVEKEIERVQGEIDRARGKLANERFVSKAPAAVVEEERRKLAVAQEMLEKLRQRRADLAEE